MDKKEHLMDTFNRKNPDFIRQKMRSNELLYTYNHAEPNEGKKKQFLLESLFGSMGKEIVIETNFQCEIGFNIHVGEHFYAGCNCTIIDMARVDIGDYVYFSPNVTLTTLGRFTELELNNDLGYAKPISIGDHVWLGVGCIVFPGVQIGPKVIAMAGSVITQDVPAQVIVAGNPARVVQPRF